MTGNEFEKRLLADVILLSDIGVTFNDTGALENLRDTLKELVMLPLERPELFCKGQLIKIVKFICLWKYVLYETSSLFIRTAVCLGPYVTRFFFRVPRGLKHGTLLSGVPKCSPDAKIFKVILAKDDLSPDVDFDAIASMTDGYSGRDLKNLSVSAAHCPLIQLEIFGKEKNERFSTLYPILGSFPC
ncbi:hypothetical protein TorRG33x02_290080 [Trema orientale]|uniref:AAA ATPase AAA+ lid domain-containing protein n=1 Tax=Trema orientale TaxID=63057 RepID=A0A2P5CCU3_TREOI|nr:hypothetical protein TorRG33x02_290080 [Trema orientale]